MQHTLDPYLKDFAEHQAVKDEEFLDKLAFIYHDINKKLVQLIDEVVKWHEEILKVQGMSEAKIREKMHDLSAKLNAEMEGI